MGENHKKIISYNKKNNKKTIKENYKKSNTTLLIVFYQDIDKISLLILTNPY